MNKHHDELVTQFELLIGVQKDLRDSFTKVESNWQETRELPCFTEISRWEEEFIERIRQVAQQARNTANEMMATNMIYIRHRLDQIAFDLEERRDQSNYLDNDILVIKNQLEQLNQNIQHVHETIHVSSSMSHQIDVESLLRVTSDRMSIENEEKSSGLRAEGKVDHEKLWMSFRRLIKTKSEKLDSKNKPIVVRRHPAPIYEPIILTSFTNKIEQKDEEKESKEVIYRNMIPLDERLKTVRSRSCSRVVNSSSQTSDV